MIAHRSDCPDDLLAASVARPLSELERRALDLHVSNCADCATACTAVALFQQIPGAEPGDDALVARVAGRLAASGGAAFAARRGRWLAVAAASLLLCTAAGAVAMGLWSRRSKVTTQPMLHVPDAVPASSARTRTPPSPPEDLVAPRPPAPEVVDPATAPRAAVKLARNRPARTVPSATEVPGIAPPDAVTAADLFRRANAARGNRQLAEAAELYRALQLRFPASPEAIVSSISLGKVLLALGDHEPALAAFDRYTGQVAPAPLMEEALVGKGRALRLLGRAAAERETWLDLLARFPGSAYEALAKQRLAELPR